jgi:hypothetical protein
MFCWFIQAVMIMPNMMQLSHNNGICDTVDYMKFNTPERKSTKYTTFLGSCNLHTAAWYMPVTGDYLACKFFHSSCLVTFCVNLHTYGMCDSAIIYRSWRVFCHQRHFNWVLAWKIWVLFYTPKPHTRWIQIYVVDVLADLSRKYERLDSYQRVSCVVYICDVW